MVLKKVLAVSLISATLFSLVGCQSDSYKNAKKVLYDVAEKHGATVIDFDDDPSDSEIYDGVIAETDDEDYIRDAVSSILSSSNKVETVTEYSKMTDECVLAAIVCEMEDHESAVHEVDAIESKNTLMANREGDVLAIFGMNSSGTQAYFLSVADEDVYVYFAVMGSGSEFDEALKIFADYCNESGYHRGPNV